MVLKKDIFECGGVRYTKYIYVYVSSSKDGNDICGVNECGMDGVLECLKVNNKNIYVSREISLIGRASW